jgi:hypothetical protein
VSTKQPRPKRGHNPTPEERDERVSLEGVDPEKALEALLHVDPESEPAEEDED